MVKINDFGLFLSRVIGRLGDRHAYIKGYKLPDKLFRPFVLAPIGDQVVALRYNAENKTYQFWDSGFPYLQSIKHWPIHEFLPSVLPDDTLAPRKTYRLRALRELRYIESVFYTVNKELVDPLPIQLEDVRTKAAINAAFVVFRNLVNRKDINIAKPFF